jgi:non-ribosomal peptide synthetase-like protein
VGPGSFIGISLERSEWPIITILAVLKAGAAYVPVEPSLPDDRLRYIVETANLAVVVTQAASANRMRKICRGALVIIEDYRCGARALAHSRLTLGEVGVKPNDPCYVLFTSGTTGRPKGVVTEHRNVVHFVGAFNDVCCTTERDRIFQGFSLGFDGSVEEMWMAFSNGATLICGDSTTPRFGADLTAFLKDRAITFLSTVPTLLSTLARDVPSLKQLVVSGEACPVDLVNRWSRHVSAMLNVYGPTESTVNTTAAVLREGVPVTIGRPLRGYEVLILDEKLEPVHSGEKGELFIGGLGLAREYINQPDLTARSFIEWPPQLVSTAESCREVKRLYRTGDLVRQNDGGDLEFLGRIDHQVKLRGHRIELAEIESVLVEHPQIAGAVVRVHEHGGVESLAAYVLLADGANGVDRSAILRTLRDKLPAYMVPSDLDVLQHFPTLSSGKVDRSKLPEPGQALVADANRPQEDMTLFEARIAAIVVKIFRLPQVGLDQDLFLELGGHSLLAAQLVNALRREMSLSVPIREVYANPTIRRLAAFIDRRGLADVADPRRSRQSQDANAPVGARKRPWCTTLVQVIYLLSVIPILALPLLYLTPLAIDALHFRASVLKLAITGLGVALAAWAALIIIALIAKWAIIGRYRPGRYPLWGSYYIRWWVVSRLQHLSQLHAFDGTPLAPAIWRAMGAEVGSGCVINAGLVYAWDCIRVGDDVSIGPDTHLPGLRIEDGYLIIGKVEIGNRCFIGSHSVLGLNVTMQDGSCLDDQSMLPDGSAVPIGASYRGSPARAQQIAVPEGAPERSSVRWLFVFCAFQLACGLAVALLILSPPAVAVWLGAILLLHYPAAVSLPAFVFIVPLCNFAFALWSALCKRIVNPAPRPGRYRVYSFAYLRYWLSDHVVLQILRTVGLPIFTTLYFPSWMRLLGARLGRNTEMSTVWRINPDMVTAGDGVFFADGCMIAGARMHLGHFEFAPTRIGDRTFIGNSAILPAGVNLGSRCLLGVLSAPPRPRSDIPDDTDWLGSPAFQLPNREKLTGFDPTTTFSPTVQLYLQRALIDGLRVVLPGYVLATIGALTLLVVPAVYTQYGIWGVHTAIALLAWAGLFIILASVIGLKWLLMGRYRPVVVPLWSRYVWWNELINGLYESLMAPLISNLFGTPFAEILLRMLGCKIGRYCYIETNLFSEFDLVTIGDRVALNAGVVLQNHLFEDRVMKSETLKIGDGCTVGNASVVLYSTVMERGSVLGPLSLLMKGETMPEGFRGHGIPLSQVVRP